ncbi:MAG: GNAT family N-acetyltransferase, partial [Desulfobacteraceae bacterium]
MEVELIENTERLSEIEKEWTLLLESSAQSDIFILPEWFFSWWEIYGGDKDLYTIALRKDRMLCGLLLLYKIKKGPFRLITFTGAPCGSDQMDFILMRNMEDECITVFIEWLYKRSDWDIVSLRDFGPFTRNPEILFDKVTQQGERCHISRELPSYYLPLDDYKDFDTYTKKTLSKNRKEQLRKGRAGLKKLDNVEWELLDGINDKIVDEMKELDTVKSSRGLKGMSFFSDPKKGMFLNGLLSGKINSESINLFCLRIGGKLVAYILNFKYMDRLLYYQASFDKAYS